MGLLCCSLIALSEFSGSFRLGFVRLIEEDGNERV